MSMCISTAQARTRWALRGCPGLGLLHFHCKFSHKRPLLRCPCEFQLRRLAQSVGRGLPWAHFSWQAQSFVDLDRKVVETRNPLVILAGRIALAVAQREFWYPSDRSRCGAASVLISLSLWRGARFDIACACLHNPSRDFGHVGSLWLWRGADFSRFVWDPGKAILWVLCKAFFDNLTRVSWCSLRDPFDIIYIYYYIYIYPYPYIYK